MLTLNIPPNEKWNNNFKHTTSYFLRGYNIFTRPLNIADTMAARCKYSDSIFGYVETNITSLDLGFE